MSLERKKCKKCEGIIENDEYIICDFREEESTVNHTNTESLSVIKELMCEALLYLSTREQNVIRLRFGLDDGMPRTRDEVAQEFNITRERVRQIEAKAFRKVHYYPRRVTHLKDFLSDEK